MIKTRNLSIMFTDVKGFTSRTSNSSREELHRFLELHEKLIAPIFSKFGGNIIKTIGDAFLVTFESPTDALLCGIEIQKVLKEHNQKSQSEEDHLEVRVAINSGEVTLKENDVFGDPVNIAARLEGVAEAGDIYFTESVYLAMNKSEIPTAKVGYRHFKGIPEEIKIYKVLQENTFSKNKNVDLQINRVNNNQDYYNQSFNVVFNKIPHFFSNHKKIIVSFAITIFILMFIFSSLGGINSMSFYLKGLGNVNGNVISNINNSNINDIDNVDSNTIINTSRNNPTNSKTCNDDIDCHVDELCINKICNSKISGDNEFYTYCYSDNDCAIGETCVNDICVS